MRFFRPSRLAPLWLIALGAACAPAWALEPCFPIVPTVAWDVAEPTYDRSNTAASLTAMSPPGRAPAPGTREMATGLYVPTTRVRVGTSSRPKAPEAGVHAVCLESVEVHLTTRAIIHVASEILANSCADQAVLAHEYNHHRIQTSLQRQAVGAFLALNPLSTTPFNDRDPDVAEALAKRYANNYIKMLMQSISNFVDPAQASFDSPEEYKRVAASCPSDFDELSRKIFRSRP